MVSPVAVSDDPSDWMESTQLADLHDTKLRLKAQSLTQLCRSEREKVLTIYGAVKRIPFAKPVKLRLRTAHEVLRAKRADAEDKATLFLALLRTVGVPARLRYVELHGDILRGLTNAIASAGRPVMEAWLDGRWRCTDTYIFDAQYVAAARARLRAQTWDWGYGLHRRGDSLWDGIGDAYLTGNEAMSASISLGVLGTFHDPYDFQVSAAYRDRYPHVTRTMRWNVLAPGMNRAVKNLRQTQPGRLGSLETL
ncbi:transglutaminase-like domain-containing protein [Ramlibacter sp. PS4R-6]|uniref:transglutaminase-like domain-containing protein n=1 Tax=Ramlibacter sp. PS4R-6 TaxID=3133438 RepID=UPI0030B6D819